MRKKSVLDELVKIAETNDTAEKTRAKLMANPRGGSDDISTIEKLYNVKPGTEKGMDYKNNIMEVAHPESKVLVNTYDKINGLVENNIERQNIILNIVNKQNNGQLAQFKYAKENLAKNLVRLGNFFDTKDNEDMVKLSDTCLNQMKKEGGWFIPIVFTLLTGIFYARQHSNYAVESIEENAELVSNLLKDMSEFSGVLGGVADVKYKDSVINTFLKVNKLVNKVLTDYKNIVPKINYEIDVKEIAKSKEKIEDVLEQNTDPKEIEKLKAFKEEWATIKETFKRYIKIISNETYQKNAIEQKGSAVKLWDYVKRQTYGFLSGGDYGLFSDQFNNLIQALEPFIVSVDKAISLQESALNNAAKLNDKIDQVEQPLNPTSLDEEAEKLKL